MSLTCLAPTRSFTWFEARGRKFIILARLPVNRLGRVEVPMEIWTDSELRYAPHKLGARSPAEFEPFPAQIVNLFTLNSVGVWRALNSCI